MARRDEEEKKKGKRPGETAETSRRRGNVLK
jgi:hypothetical protein